MQGVQYFIGANARRKVPHKSCGGKTAMNYKEDDLVLCTVRSIEGTTVFVDIDSGGKGHINFSEVSAGRIRNLREFISVGKKIVCKVLRIREDNIELSLRRVTVKEREAMLEKRVKERTLRAILAPVMEASLETVLEKIAEDYEHADFLDKARETPALIEKYVSKAQAETLKKIFSERREKEKELKKIIIIKSMGESGLKDVQNVLSTDKAEIRYLGSSKFSVIVKNKDFKSGNAKIAALLEELKERAKQKHVYFEIKEP